MPFLFIIKIPKMRSLCILLVDDDKIERLKFKKVCQEANFKSNIIEAKDGETALLLLDDCKTPFDLIISDLNMPGIDGFEFLSTLKNNSKLKNIPIVILSTSQRKIDLDRCYKFGISGYFTKPLKFSDYSDSVISLLKYWDKASLSSRLYAS